MSTYETEFSNFPNEKITRHHFKNVDDNIAGVINQINELRSQGLYDQAARIIQNNQDILSQYVVWIILRCCYYIRYSQFGICMVCFWFYIGR